MEDALLQVVGMVFESVMYQIASRSQDGFSGRIWNTYTGHGISDLAGYEVLWRWNSWSPDGRRLASLLTDSQTIRVWDAASSQVMTNLRRHRELIHLDGTVRIWNPVTGQSTAAFRTSDSYMLKFDDTHPTRLHTSVGTWDVQPNDSSTPAYDKSLRRVKPRAYGISNDESLITYDGCNVTWLPVEYRHVSNIWPYDDYRQDKCSRFFAHGNRVTIIHPTKGCLVLKFSNRPPLPSS
ncbi:hypothetical protein N7539_008150 [Penicillium diatomitis]|uniref:Uncharacterized protein n=1 Tax=Penicillium diatomitis TaxID=2819901 RepID=A0A9W9WT92_9EURO|nr:uncharacterized protein N7539_008150 [Penicillium diatomitis]KAJ5475084.1 hypothetical protein N7539_008150 [Penicillium diatomitis]